MRLLLLLVLFLPGCVSEPPTPEPASDALVLGAIGNSLMLGYNADEDHIESAPEVSWATGDETWSFRARVGATAVENVAEPGAGSDAFAAQVDALEEADLVLVMPLDPALCGAGDAPFEDRTGSFEADLRDGLAALRSRGMAGMLVSPPDIISIAEAARAKPPANDFVLFYAMGQECAQEPGARERQAEMVATIARIAKEEGALHDHGAVASIRWTPEMVSDMDGLHPSLVGLEAIATAVWDAYEATARFTSP